MKNSVVLITGDTSGNGSATALKFASAGAKVVVSGRRETEGNAVVEGDKIRRRGSHLRSDVAQEAQVAESSSS